MKLSSKIKNSIKIRTASIIIVILTLSFGISTFINAFYVRSVLKEAIINEISASGIIVTRMVDNSLKYFPLDNFSGMTSYLKNVIKNTPKLRYIFISSKEGMVLYHSDEGHSGKQLQLHAYPPDAFSSRKTEIRIYKYLEIIVPILSHKMIAGYIHLGIEQKAIDSKVFSFVLITGTIFVLTLMISISFLLFFISRKVINPITHLAGQIKSIAEKKTFDKELIFSGDDEVSHLGNAFGKLMQEINHYSSKLEYLVEQRTTELQKVYYELESKTRKIDREMKMAALLQNSILPAEFPVLQEISISAYYNSMEHIGGDYYDIFPLGENKFGIVIADVSGHGVPAALVTMMAKVAFTTFAKDGYSSDIILEKVNQELVKVLGLEVMHYLTAFFLIFDTTNNTIQYSNAGHIAQLIYSASIGDCISLKTYGRFLGLHPDSVFGRKEMLLHPQDKILLFTDGIIEAKDPDGNLYKHERLIEFTKRNFHLKAADFVQQMAEDIRIFTQGSPQSDDQAIIVIDIQSEKNQDLIKENFKQRKYEVERLISTAEKVYQTQDYEYAARLYIQAMHKEGKNDSAIMLKVADCYEIMNDLENAVKYLEFAVSLEPKDVELRKHFYSLCDKLRNENMD